MRWGKPRLSAEERRLLEQQLQASLVPVEVDQAFVERVHRQLASPRPLYVPQARSWSQAWLVFGGLSGTLLLLGGLTIFLFAHRRKKR